MKLCFWWKYCQQCRVESSCLSFCQSRNKGVSLLVILRNSFNDKANVRLGSFVNILYCVKATCRLEVENNN